MPGICYIAFFKSLFLSLSPRRSHRKPEYQYADMFAKAEGHHGSFWLFYGLLSLNGRNSTSYTF